MAWSLIASSGARLGNCRQRERPFAPTLALTQSLTIPGGRPRATETFWSAQYDLPSVRAIAQTHAQNSLRRMSSCSDVCSFLRRSASRCRPRSYAVRTIPPVISQMSTISCVHLKLTSSFWIAKHILQHQMLTLQFGQTWARDDSLCLFLSCLPIV